VEASSSELNRTISLQRTVKRFAISQPARVVAATKEETMRNFLICVLSLAAFTACGDGDKKTPDVPGKRRRPDVR
jgi:hypothetical protein